MGIDGLGHGKTSHDMDRRRFLQGMLAAGASATLSACTPETKMDFDIEKLNASFEQFNGLPGNVLVVGANSNANHYRMAIQSILDRNPKNGEKILQITESEAGLYAVITINVMDESADGDHALHEKKITVVNADHSNFEQAIKKAHAENGRDFSIIQFRGSQNSSVSGSHQDIVNIHRKLNGVGADIMKNSLLFFGGCRGIGWLKMYTPQSPVIVEQGTGQAAINSAILVQLIKDLGSKKYRSWNELYKHLSSAYEKNTPDLVIPGAPNYMDKIQEAIDTKAYAG